MVIKTLSNKLFVRHWKKSLYKQLETFRNIHSGEDCFIIGNGPSLNKMDLTLLNDYHTFGLNKIYLIFKRQPLKLSYHVAVNSLVIEQSKDYFNTSDCPTFLAQEAKWKNKIRSKNTFAICDLLYEDLFYKDITKGITPGYTVTYVAMQIAYFMGFKRVFLVGVDHNFAQTGQANEKQRLNGDDQNHFDPNYFKGQDWHLADLEKSEIFYSIAKYIYEKNDRSIYDATIDGKLDIFQKINYEEALKLAKKKLETHGK